MMRAAFVLAAVLVSGCGGSSGVCRWPAEAQTAGDASMIGCSASPTFDVCEQQNDGSQQCRDACTSSEYALSCYKATPADSLRCTTLPLPTPQDVLIYCCPCASS